MDILIRPQTAMSSCFRDKGEDTRIPRRRNRANKTQHHKSDRAGESEA